MAAQDTQFRTMDDVRHANRALGHHWFDADTLRFFDSRVGGELFAGRYFVSSERYDEQSPRLYTIREVKPDGSIDTVGDFQAYKTNDAAKRAIWRKLNQDALYDSAGVES